MRFPGGRWLLTVGLMLAVSLILAGCGSDAGSAAESTPTSGPVQPVLENPAPDLTPTRANGVPPASESVPTSTPLVAIQATETPVPAPEATPHPTKPKPTRTPNRDLGDVGRIIMTRAVDSRQRPTDPAAVFGEDERVYVSVEFQGVRKDAVLGVRWLRAGVESFVFELDPTDAFTRGFFAFFFDPGGPGSVGRYSVEALINGEIIATAEFEVRTGGGDAAPAG